MHFRVKIRTSYCNTNTGYFSKCLPKFCLRWDFKNFWLQIASQQELI